MKSLILRSSENLRYYRSHLALFLYLTVFLAISSVPVFLSFKISSILLLQVVVGQEIYRSISKRVQVSTIERMAMGFSIGSLVWLLVDQFLLWMSLPGIGWLLISLQIIFVLLVNHRRANENSGLFPVSFEAVGWLTVASLFGLSGEWVWPLPLAAVGGCVVARQLPVPLRSTQRLGGYRNLDRHRLVRHGARNSTKDLVDNPD